MQFLERAIEARFAANDPMSALNVRLGSSLVTDQQTVSLARIQSTMDSVEKSDKPNDVIKAALETLAKKVVEI